MLLNTAFQASLSTIYAMAMFLNTDFLTENMKFAITIPAYNEEKTLPKVLSEIKEVMKKTRYDYQVFVVDDGSEDKTAAVARKAGAKVFSNRTNFGLMRTFQRVHELGVPTLAVALTALIPACRQPTAERIVAMTAEAMAGAVQIEDIRTLRIRMVYPDHEYPVVTEVSRPNRMRTEGVGSYVLVFDSGD